MTETPVFDQLVADPKFQLSEWLGTAFEPWPDPYVVLPPSPSEAQRLAAEWAGWDTQELGLYTGHAKRMADAELTLARMTEPEPEPEPEEEEKDNANE